MSWLDKMIAFTVQQNGATIGTRQIVNLQNLTATDDATNGRINVTSNTSTVNIGALHSGDYTLTSGEATATNIVVCGSWDGGGNSVVFPAGTTFANDSITTATNLTNERFNLTLGASSVDVDPLSTVQIVWSAGSFSLYSQTCGRHPFMLKFNVAAGVATLAYKSNDSLGSSSAAKNAAGDFTVTVAGLPSGASIVAAQLTPNTTGGLDPKAVITAADKVRCYTTYDSDFTLVFWLSF